MEENGFVLVKRKNKHSKRKGNNFMVTETIDSLDLSPIETGLTKLELVGVRQRVEEYKVRIIQHPVWVSVTNRIDEATGSTDISEIVCYGLGSLLSGSSTYASRQQLALLLALRDKLSVAAHVFDPVFNSQDVELCKSLNIDSLPQNDFGKKYAALKTIFFMPRCPFELFNNIIETNRENLSNIIIFGNDLTLLDLQLPSHEFKRQFPFICDSLPMTCILKPCFAGSPLEDVMNNCVIHTFCP